MAIIEGNLPKEQKTIDGVAVADKLTANKAGENTGDSTTWQKNNPGKDPVAKNITQFKTDLKQSIEQTDIESAILKKQLQEAEEAHLQQKKDELENDETHKEVLKNTVNNPPKIFVPRLFPAVEYSFEIPNLTEGKPKTINRAFKIELEWDDEHEEFFLIVKKKKLCKQDILNLYNAFRIVVKDKMDFLFSEHKKMEKRSAEEREKRELQAKLFAQDFREPDILEIPISLPIFTRLANEMVDFKFPVIQTRGLGYALKLNSENALTCQDIYYVYSNFENILNRSLHQPEEEAA
jgi:hypothetical protein